MVGRVLLPFDSCYHPIIIECGELFVQDAVVLVGLLIQLLRGYRRDLWLHLTNTITYCPIIEEGVILPEIEDHNGLRSS